MLMCKLDVLYSRKQLTTWSRTRCRKRCNRAPAAASSPCSRCCGTWVESEQSEAIQSFPDVSRGSGHGSDSSMWTQNGLRPVSLCCCFVLTDGWHTQKQLDFIQHRSAVIMCMCKEFERRFVYDHYFQTSLWMKWLLKHIPLAICWLYNRVSLLSQRHMFHCVFWSSRLFAVLFLSWKQFFKLAPLNRCHMIYGDTCTIYTPRWTATVHPRTKEVKLCDRDPSDGFREKTCGFRNVVTAIGNKYADDLTGGTDFYCSDVMVI